MLCEATRPRGGRPAYTVGRAASPTQSALAGAKMTSPLPAATTLTNFDSTTYDPLDDDDERKDPDLVFGEQRGEAALLRGAADAGDAASRVKLGYMQEGPRLLGASCRRRRGSGVGGVRRVER